MLVGTSSFNPSSDVLDHTLDLVDSLTFNTKVITEEMWPIFEQIYKLFKNNVIDFLEGKSLLTGKIFGY
jgi:hypothetical protein